MKKLGFDPVRKACKQIHRSDSFNASKVAQDEVFKNPNIDVIWDSQIRKIKGDNFKKRYN